VGDAGALSVRFGVQLPHRAQLPAHANPYSESQFKTMKYRPDFPARFGCIEDARAHCRTFFAWYNTRHRHSSIGYMTPHSVHYGHAQALREARVATLDAAFLARPDRFKGHRPQPHPLPTAAWINPPPMENFIPEAPQPCTVNS
jgi:putative transposase